MTMKERIKAEAYDDKQGAEMYSLLQKYETEYPVDITGDACEGDEVVFLRAVFGGSKKNPKFLRHKRIIFLKQTNLQSPWMACGREIGIRWGASCSAM